MAGAADVIRKAREVLDVEIGGIAAARDRIGDAFVQPWISCTTVPARSL